jgi:tight adherence protein B
MPFWRSSLAVVIAALVAAMLLGLAIGLLVKHFAGSGNLRGRVGEFIPTPPAEQRGGVPPLPGLDTLGSPASALERSRWWPRFAEDVDISRLGISALGLVQLTVAGAIVLAVILWLATGSVLAALGALLLAPVLLRGVVNYNVRRQRALFSAQLPPHLEEVSGAMRAGRSLVEALAVVADGADEPTRSEFDRALADERMGQPLEETLRPISARMKSPDVDQLAVIAALHRGSGANVAEVLEHVAEAARQRDDMRRELRVMTAQARMTRWILTALPVAMLLILAVLRPDYERPLFHTSAGHMFIVGAALLVLIGSFMMSRIVDIEA